MLFSKFSPSCICGFFPEWSEAVSVYFLGTDGASLDFFSSEEPHSKSTWQHLLVMW